VRLSTPRATPFRARPPM